jgi:D-aminoacyl-tRNA deacylase
MRLVIQRVSRCELLIADKIYSQIGNGLLVLLGIEIDDSEEDIAYLSSKLCNLRIFSDSEGKMNLDVKQINGEILVVSQFTLHALTKKGNRPSFIKAARPEKAIPLYEKFLSDLKDLLNKPIKSGEFGADMKVSLVNDGPVTIVMDSKMKE